MRKCHPLSVALFSTICSCSITKKSHFWAIERSKSKKIYLISWKRLSSSNCMLQNNSLSGFFTSVPVSSSLWSMTKTWDWWPDHLKTFTKCLDTIKVKLLAWISTSWCPILWQSSTIWSSKIGLKPEPGELSENLNKFSAFTRISSVSQHSFISKSSPMRRVFFS